MRFCDKCGSRMREERAGFTCPKCGNVVHAKPRMLQKNVKKVEHLNSVYVVNSKQDGNVKVIQACPKCGNKEAFHWYSEVSGEHAGIRTETTIEHFRCTKCSYTWNKSS